MVYLETGFAELAKRVGLDRARPLLIGTNPRAQLKALLEQRLPVYDRLAWLTVQHRRPRAGRDRGRDRGCRSRAASVGDRPASGQ